MDKWYLSTKVCVLNKKKDVSVKIFNMITRVTESKTHFIDQKWNNEKHQSDCKKYSMCRKD